MKANVFVFVCILFLTASAGAAEALCPGMSGETGSGMEASEAASERQARLDRILASGEFNGASVSVLAVTADGDTLFRADPGRQCVPASNLKLVTTGLALHALGPDYRFRTGIGYSGSISGGVLHGDLYILGGGDPTLGSHNAVAEPLDSVFARWLRLMRAAGIESVDGYVIGDGRFFPGMPEHGSWQLNDCGTYYGSGVSGLSFYENEVDFRVVPGAREGDPLDISPVWPEMPWMTFSYACSTGPADGVNSLYFYTSAFAPFGEMRGRLAVNRKERIEAAANKFPEFTTANYFYNYLKDNGVACSMRPADLGPVFGPQEREFTAADFGAAGVWGGVSEGPAEWASMEASSADSGQGAGVSEEAAAIESGLGDSGTASGPSVLGWTESPRLAEIVGVTNRDSNNMYAETLMKALGREVAGEGTYEGAYRAESQLFAKLGVSTRNVVVRDGSGLSREDHVSAGFLCAFLRAMMASPAGPAFVGSLPYPGSEGTLSGVLKDAPAALRPRIRMKSGSMGGVRCFSGYVLPTDDGNDEDTVIFSVLVNNYSVPTYRIQRKIEEIILLLAE